MTTGKAHIGTSGWHYDHWTGPFYPEGLSEARQLAFYADHFSTVEINNSFYQLPKTETFRMWAQTVPEGFLFATKASRYMTHMKKLKDPVDPVERFYRTSMALGEKAGPVLFQLPPKWRANPDRLEAFLEALPGTRRAAFEFRDKSWFSPRVLSVLEKYNAAFVIYELAGTHSPVEMTADFAYIRLHGPEDAYEGDYSEAALEGWAERIQAWTGQGRDIYVYFDNDQKGYAPKNAHMLQEKLSA